MIKKRNDLRDNIGVRKARQKDMTMYNPMQSQLDRIAQQRQMLEQQEQMLRQNMQQYQMPNININNIPAAMPTNYDFGCKWINDDAEANNLPNNVIGFYKNDPIFVMSGKKFRFSEVIEQPTPSIADEKYNALERQIKAITERLDKLSINTQVIQEKPTEATKPTKKGGIANE